MGVAASANALKRLDSIAHAPVLAHNATPRTCTPILLAQRTLSVVKAAAARCKVPGYFRKLEAGLQLRKAGQDRAGQSRAPNRHLTSLSFPAKPLIVARDTTAVHTCSSTTPVETDRTPSKKTKNPSRELQSSKPPKMGIPYSKQIHAAFDQVTPLVAAGFEVLQTTKNISILLAAIQVVTVVILALILLTLLALLVSVNPDLEAERVALVTPVVRWCACWAMPECEARGRVGVAAFVLGVVLFVVGWVWYAVETDVKEVAAEEAVETERKGEVEKE
ncbi:hypothetical protein Q7P37_005971 [Cladosporium fusiforme]